MGAGASTDLRQTLNESTADSFARQLSTLPEENQLRIRKALEEFEQRAKVEAHSIDESSDLCQREEEYNKNGADGKDDGDTLFLPVKPDALTEKTSQPLPVTTKIDLAEIRAQVMSQLQASEAGLDRLAERIKAKQEFIEVDLRSKHESAVGAVEAHLHAIEAIETRMAGLARKVAEASVDTTAADYSFAGYESRSLFSTSGGNGFHSLVVGNSSEDGHKTLLQHTAVSDSGRQGMGKRTALMMAVQDGQHQRALELVQMQANPNATSDDGTSALMLASGQGHGACVNVLLSVGAHVDHAHDPGSTNLMNECRRGHDQCAKTLIDAGTDLNASNIEGSTALTLASDNGHEDCVKILCGAGARVNHADGSGITSLMFAVVKGHDRCAQAMIEAKADIEMADQEGFTALMYSCEDGHILCTQALIEAGAQIDKVGPHGGTALIYSSSNGHARCAQMLIELQADPNTESQEGSTALTLASGNGHLACVKVLLDAKAHVDHLHNSGSTSLMYACLNGHGQCAQTLIQARASLHATGRDNFTMLMAASKGGLSSIIELLMPHNSIDATVIATHAEEGGYSALMYSCLQGHVEVAKQLVQSGANRNHNATDGATAQSLAHDNHHFAVCKLLSATPSEF